MHDPVDVYKQLCYREFELARAITFQSELKNQLSVIAHKNQNLRS